MTVGVAQASAATGGNGQNVALIVGNSTYEHASSLRNPIHDASAVAEALRHLGFKVVDGLDLTRPQLEEHSSRFAAALEQAQAAVFFYAGHGLQINGRNYLVPVDFDPTSNSDLSKQLINVDRVLGRMASPERVSIVFLDACRNNPFASQLRASMNDGRSLFIDDERAVKIIGDGLAEVEAGVGSLIAFATQPGNVALDGAGNHSPFTEGLLRYIEKPGLEVSNLLKNVRKYVYRKTGGQQVPWDHSSLVERYYFKKKIQRAAPAP